MEKWEYQTEIWDYHLDGNFETWLSKLGQEGWELVEADLYDDSPRRCIFKRKIQDTPEDDKNKPMFSGLDDEVATVLEYCVSEILTTWEKSYKEECKNKELLKNPIAKETLLYKRDWINTMKSILNNLDPKAWEITDTEEPDE